MKTLTNKLTLIPFIITMAFILQSCEQKQQETTQEVEKVVEEEVILKPEKPDYFMLRPDVEKAYGYTHAVKIGNDIKISGAVKI